MKSKGRLVEQYAHLQSTRLYGVASIQAIERQFPVWRWYFRRLLRVNRTAKVLDIGCGNGGFVHFLRGEGFTNVWGIDASISQVEDAKRLAIDGVNIGEICECLSHVVAEYDVIVARDVIEHLPKEAVSEVFRLINLALRDEGLVVVQVPNGESPFFGRVLFSDVTHETCFTRHSLGQLFALTGFINGQFLETGPVPHGLVSTCRYILWKCMRLIMAAAMLIETGSGSGVFTQTVIAVGTKRNG